MKYNCPQQFPPPRFRKGFGHAPPYFANTRDAHTRSKLTPPAWYLAGPRVVARVLRFLASPRGILFRFLAHFAERDIHAATPLLPFSELSKCSEKQQGRAAHWHFVVGITGHCGRRAAAQIFFLTGAGVAVGHGRGGPWQRETHGWQSLGEPREWFARGKFYMNTPLYSPLVSAPFNHC